MEAEKTAATDDFPLGMKAVSTHYTYHLHSHPVILILFMLFSLFFIIFSFFLFSSSFSFSFSATSARWRPLRLRMEFPTSTTTSSSPQSVSSLRMPTQTPINSSWWYVNSSFRSPLAMPFLRSSNHVHANQLEPGLSAQVAPAGVCQPQERWKQRDNPGEVLQEVAQPDSGVRHHRRRPGEGVSCCCRIRHVPPQSDATLLTYFLSFFLCFPQYDATPKG